MEAWRWRAQHLAQRLPPGSLVDAAWGGLQDSAPRQGVLSLHARAGGVEPDSWADPSLVQVYGPRGAVYLVPRADVAVFTVGRLPRNPAAAAELERLADGVVAGRPAHRLAVRHASPTGRLHIVWDASTTTVVPVEPPAVDVEAARVELARRFVTWFGPTTAAVFATWAGVDGADAAATLAALGAADTVAQPPGDEAPDDEAPVVRLVPPGDPYLYGRPAGVVAEEAHRQRVFVNGPGATGVVVVDGDGIGAWVRRQGRTTVELWSDPGTDVRSMIEREALTFPLAAALEVVFGAV